MTCIVGLVDDERMWMGGDSMATLDAERHLRKDIKIFRKQGYLIGVAGSPRPRQLLQHGCQLPTPSPGANLEGFMVVHFIDAIRQLFATAGYLEILNDRQAFDDQILVARDGRLFVIYGDMQIEEMAWPFAAIGAAAQEAYASLWTTHALKIKDAKTRLRLALEAAAEFNNTVASPFRYLSAKI